MNASHKTEAIATIDLLTKEGGCGSLDQCRIAKRQEFLDHILSTIAYTFHMPDTAISVNKIGKLAGALLIIF